MIEAHFTAPEFDRYPGYLKFFAEKILGEMDRNIIHVSPDTIEQIVESQQISGNFLDVLGKKIEIDLYWGANILDDVLVNMPLPMDGETLPDFLNTPFFSKDEERDLRKWTIQNYLQIRNTKYVEFLEKLHAPLRAFKSQLYEGERSDEIVPCLRTINNQNPCFAFLRKGSIVLELDPKNNAELARMAVQNRDIMRFFLAQRIIEKQTELLFLAEREIKKCAYEYESNISRYQQNLDIHLRISFFNLLLEEARKAPLSLYVVPKNQSVTCAYAFTISSGGGDFLKFEWDSNSDQSMQASYMNTAVHHLAWVSYGLLDGDGFSCFSEFDNQSAFKIDRFRIGNVFQHIRCLPPNIHLRSGFEVDLEDAYDDIEHLPEDLPGFLTWLNHQSASRSQFYLTPPQERQLPLHELGTILQGVN